MPDDQSTKPAILESVSCPACETRFRCQLSDLAIANGLLRCGVCQHVLNAAEQLTEAQRDAYEALSKPTSDTALDNHAPEDSDDVRRGSELLEGLTTNDHGFEFHRPQARRRWHWIAFNIAALLTLLGQGAYWQRSYLLGLPNLSTETKQHILLQCERLSIDCTLKQPQTSPQPSRDIVSQKLLVRPHPTVADALQVDAILLNRGDRSADFPLLRLRFSNIHGIELASRIFHPSEYLAGELNALSQLNSGQPVHIALEIVAPAPEAVNYELALFSRP